MTIIGIDPGCDNHGVAIISGDSIVATYNANTDLFWDILTNYILQGVKAIVIEDLAAYRMAMTPQVLTTAKFIGEATYRIRSGFSGELRLVERSTIKRWAYNTYELVPQLCQQKSDKIQAKRNSDDNEMTNSRRASFVYVDDRMIQLAMIHEWGIVAPKAGKGYPYGLKSHSWQALSAATWYKKTPNVKTSGEPLNCL